ncbi:MAG: thioredoxin [Candidatus Zophobacter franzmannii]|jgi:thioredoxin 1|nr:thioredoxin [Candidatus Zophobacter franzmannii]
MPIELTTANFEETIKEGVTLVDFWAPWCAPCHMIAPHVEAIEKEMPEITVAKINIDSSPEIAAKFGIMSIPTIMIFKDGKQHSTTIGVVPKKTLIDKVKSAQ